MNEFDLTTSVLIVGGGPAGLACAWRIKQLAPDRPVVLIDKAANAGGHLVSGASMDTCAMDALWPDWSNHVPHTEVTKDKLAFLTKRRAIPVPSLFENKGNAIISINLLAAKLAKQAEAAGVDVLYGFAGQALIGDDKIEGIICTDGTRIGAEHVILAEGCFGNLSQDAITRFNLRRAGRHQTYGLGIKEIWQVKPERFQGGLAMHTIGWPLPGNVHGGGWIYHYGENLVSLGLITALDYDNPTLSPFDEMQQWKTHPQIKTMLEGATRIGYQARAVVEGGLQSLPRLDFPGGMLIGDSAGFLNPARLKGIHMAIQSGMLAAEAIISGQSLQSLFEKSALKRELYKARNVRPGFRFGRMIGIINAATEMLGAWRGPFTLPAPRKQDRQHYNPDMASRMYPPPDNVLTFDKLSSLSLCAMQEPQLPSHLLLENPDLPEQRQKEPSPFYCPAGVYEFVQGRFVVNYANCIHCKTCAIKDPDGNIVWTPNSGGSGPSYESI